VNKNIEEVDRGKKLRGKGGGGGKKVKGEGSRKTSVTTNAAKFQHAGGKNPKKKHNTHTGGLEALGP